MEKASFIMDPNCMLTYFVAQTLSSSISDTQNWLRLKITAKCDEGI